MDILNTTITMLPLVQLVNNEGQLDGVPKNPRQITEAEYRKLVQSLRKDNLTGIEPLKVYKQGEQYVVLGGNQRLRALRELKRTEVPCIIIPASTPADVLRKVVINDNSNYGEWDMDDLANEWDEQELSAWSVDLPKWEEKETERLSRLQVKGIYYEPVCLPNIQLADCVNLTKFDAKMEVIENAELPDDIKDVLKMFAYRFVKIDFEAVANYYAFIATEAEKRVIERLRMVLVDGGIEGFIEDDMLRINEEMYMYDE